VTRRSYHYRNKIDGPFAPRLIKMLKSPGYRVLSLSAHRALARLEIELYQHGGDDNGRLMVTYDQLVEYGIDRDSIAPAIRELAALGFIEITEQGRAGAGTWHEPNQFRLTFRHVGRARPTHEWQRIETAEQAAVVARAARKASASKNRTPVGENRSFQSQKRRPEEPISGPGTPDWNPVGKTPTPSISRVDVSNASARVPSSQSADARARAPQASEGFGEDKHPAIGQHTRESLLTYVANVIDEQLHNLDRARVSAHR
jgi:hypothetical protein